MLRYFCGGVRKALSQIGSAAARSPKQPADTAALTSPAQRKGFIRRIIDYYSRSNIDRTFEKKIDWSIVPGPNYSSDVGFGIGFLVAGLYRIDRTDSVTAPSNISIYGNVTTEKFVLLRFSGDNIFNHNKQRLSYAGAFVYFPGAFYGVGYNAGAEGYAQELTTTMGIFRISYCTSLVGRFYIGVSGGIAAYKMANVASALRKLGADVEVIMTKNATQFITPITFETLTGHKCMVDTFDRDFKFEVTHISLAKKADVILVAPATANVIAKMAHGIADDMLTTTVLAAKCPKLVSPAMNTGMLENPITQDNLATLERYGFTVIPSESGVLACKDVGSGRLPKEDVLIEYILHTIARPKDLAGVRIAVTAGPTQEPLDPVRYLTNHSTGKMGYAVARAAAMRGAEVTLIHGPTALQPVRFTEDVPITTAQQMYEAVTSRFDEMDVLVMAAAVADYRPAAVADDKIKKKDGDLSIAVERTPDILGTIGPKKKGQFLCGFAMETENLIENARGKLERKNLDMIAANSLRTKGAGFAGDTNVVTLLTKDETEELPMLSKDETADRILTKINTLRKG